MPFRSIQPRPFRYTRASLYAFVAALFGPAVLLAQTATTTSLALSLSQVPAGTAVQLTATVEAGAQPVSPGQVLFYDGKALLGTAQLLSSGTASMNLRFGTGAHSITASFAGTKIYGKSSAGAQSLTVTATLATSTTLNASGTNPYALIATVTGAGLPAPAGSVTFTDQTNDTALGSAPLGAATATQTFQAQKTYGTGILPYSVTVGDFNGDGIPDLAVANHYRGTVGVLLGNGNGTFQPQTTYEAFGGPLSVAVGDFNGDGVLDLAVANDGTETVSVLLGNGNGTFQPQTLYVTGNWPSSVAVGDFNGDGIPDLAVTNRDDYTVSVLLGKGDGTFQAQTTYGTGKYPYSVVVGDFNGDGIPDLAVANVVDGISSGSVSVLLGKGDGTFQVQTTYGTGSSPFSLAVGDFNGDGIPDLAVANYNSNTVSVLIGKGDGTFQAQTTYGTGSNPRSVAVGDFNDDGIPDLAVANNGDDTVSVLPGKGDGTFQAQTTYGSGSVPQSVAGGDFNGDGIADLAVTNANGNSVSVLLNAITQSASATLPNTRVVGTGSHTLQASYPGNAIYAASSASTSVQAKQLATTLALSAPSTATTGETVQLVASLSPHAYSDLTTNREAVTFQDGNTVLGTAPLSNGTATLPATFSVAGLHTLQGSYGGDMNFQSSQSTRVTVTVTPKTSTTTILSSNPNPSTPGASVNFSATVSPAAGATGTPSGNVSFTDLTTNTVLGTVLLSTVNGAQVAILYTSALTSTGAHTIVAGYQGDSKFTSSSASVQQTVSANGKVTPTVDLTVNGSSSATVAVGDIVTFVGRIHAAPGYPSPTGSITISDPNTGIICCLGTISKDPNSNDGLATIKSFNFTVGSYTLVATYGGDNPDNQGKHYYNGAQSNTVSLMVKPSLGGPPPRPSVTISATAGARNGQLLPVSLTISNNGTAPATSISLSQIALRTLAGTRQAALFAPTVPVIVGELQPGASTVVTLELQVPTTIRKLAMSEYGTLQDGGGNVHKFDSGQVLFR